MTLSDKDNLEYFLLRNYKEIALIARGILLKADFDSLDKIQNNSWFIPMEESELDRSKRMSIGMVQADLIAKMMMYVEDFALISEGLLRETSYSELLDQKINPKTNEDEDVGKIIKQFFQKVTTLSKEDLQKILSYGNPEDYTTDGGKLELLKKSLEMELDEFKNIVKLIYEFGKEHHPYFRRYKHAGFPFNPGFQIVEHLPDYAKSFDFISLVYVNKNPFDKPKIIPYSDKIKESYHIIIHGLQQMLLAIIENKMQTIQRGKKLPPIPYSSAHNFTSEEMKIFEDILQKYDEENPVINTKFKITLSGYDYDTWYSHLDKFLETCKENKRIGEDFAKKTNYRYSNEKTKDLTNK